jgi:AraC-like DNA-binding protein
MTELAYNEWTPEGSAADLVRCVWSLRGNANGRAADPIVSDGCVELVFNLADPFEQVTDAGPRLQPLTMMVGPTYLPTVVRPTGRIDIVGVRLQPWAGAAVLGTSMGKFRDRCLPLADVSPGALIDLAGQLRNEPADDARFQVAAATVVRVPRQRPDPVVRAAIELIPGYAEAPTVGELARRVGRSVRTMQRVFAEEVGLSPKELLRIARVQRALALSRAEPPLRWITIAAQAGYHDQPHLVREFHELVGCTPSEFREDPKSLAATFLESL